MEPSLDGALLDAAFPFLIVVDEDLRITHAGPSLRRVLPGIQGCDLLAEFAFERWSGPDPEFELLLRAERLVCVLAHRRSPLMLRGAFLGRHGERRLYFLGQPRIMHLDALEGLHLSIDDFAVHDGLVDNLLLLQGRDAALRDANDLATRLHRKSRDLKSARDEAQAANRAKSAFLANISHEIRTPMNGVLGMSELLLHAELPEEDLELVEAIHDSASALIEIINDLLNFSKIEAGRVELEEIPFDLRELAVGVRRLLIGSASEKGISLNLELDKDLPAAILGDPTRVRQVLINLCGNAVKFTSSGSVTLRVERTIEDAGARLVFEVEDTGPGIPAEIQSSILEPFSQADESTTRRFGGTGLGLSISKGLLRLMGSDLTIQSEVGTGSVFGFVLEERAAELPEVEPEESEETRSTDQETTSSKRVLVVDDNAVNRLFVRRALDRIGAECLLACDGEEALAVLREESVDLVLMDLQMPGMDGWTATEHLRASTGPARDTPVLALTANLTDTARERCTAAGMNGFLSKPVRIEALTEAIQSWTQPRRRSA